MSESQDGGSSGLGRRALLASAAAGAAGVAGCLSRFRTVRSQEIPDQLSLELLTLPADDDGVATRIARRLANNLEAVGIAVDVVLYPEDELRREVLINQEYDLFVAAHPNVRDGDSLRALLHSRFVGELGWQNPFEFTDLRVDELLERQRVQSGPQRRETVVELQEEFVRQQPFVPVAVPDAVRASRSERFAGWQSVGSGLLQSLAELDQPDEPAETLRLVSTDERVTGSLNPLAIEYRDWGRVTDLIYDSLGRRWAGEIHRWAAADWELTENSGETTATVTLRPDLEFHDGTPLTAEDVVFTVELMQDTGRGDLEITAPAPRFRGRCSLVEAVTAVDEQTVEMTFPETSPETARRAFTVPILPREEWADKTDPAEIAGVELTEAVTEALVWENEQPVGSGPFRLESRSDDQQLVLERNDDHFLSHGPDQLPTPLDDRFAGGFPFERLAIRIVRSDDAALGLLTEGEVDATVTDLNPAVVPRIGREPTLELHIDQSPALYLVGCNTAREPLGNPHFRRLLARLVDKGAIRRDVFEGFARPATSPLAGTEWVPAHLAWDDGDPELPFLGSDGEPDAERARESLREAGFELSDDGEVLEQ